VLIRPYVTAALVHLGYPGDLPQRRASAFDLLTDPRVTREPPGALAERKRERALAGGSGGTSGPCRPGLKPYRKSSPRLWMGLLAGWRANRVSARPYGMNRLES
jgi:hypothetical protein